MKRALAPYPTMRVNIVPMAITLDTVDSFKAVYVIGDPGNAMHLTSPGNSGRGGDGPWADVKLCTIWRMRDCGTAREHVQINFYGLNVAWMVMFKVSNPFYRSAFHRYAAPSYRASERRQFLQELAKFAGDTFRWHLWRDGTTRAYGGLAAGPEFAWETLIGVNKRQCV